MSFLCWPRFPDDEKICIFIHYWFFLTWVTDFHSILHFYCPEKHLDYSSCGYQYNQISLKHWATPETYHDNKRYYRITSRTLNLLLWLVIAELRILWGFLNLVCCVFFKEKGNLVIFQQASYISGKMFLFLSTATS